MKRIRLFLFFFLLASLLNPSFAQTQPTVTVTGHGEAELKPAEAVFMFVLERQGPEIGQLFGWVDGLSSTFIDSLKKIGIPKKDISDKGNIIIQNYLGEQVQGNISDLYKVKRQIQVTLRDLQLLDKVRNKATEQEITQVNGPIFDYPDRGMAEETARLHAMDDAKKNAMTQAPGMTLGTPQVLSKNVSTSLASQASIPGEMTLSMDVSITYPLAGKSDSNLSK